MLTPFLLAALVAGGPPAPGPTLVVVNKDESSVSIIDLGSARVLATLPTGSGPHECATSTDGRWAVVTNYGGRGDPGNSLTVVDLGMLAVARTIVLDFERPHGITFLPDNRTVAVTSEAGQVVLLVDVETGKVGSLAPTGQRVSHMVAVSADGRRAYTANIGPGSVSRLDLGGLTEPRILPVGPQTEAIGLAPDESEVWLGSNSTGKVFAVNIAEWAVRDSVQTPGHPYRITFAPGGESVLVTNPFSDEVQLIDPSSKRIVATIRTPGEGGRQGQPFGIAFAPDGRTAWITLRGADQVAELDLAARTIRRYLPTGRGPDGIGFTVRR